MRKAQSEERRAFMEWRRFLHGKDSILIIDDEDAASIERHIQVLVLAEMRGAIADGSVCGSNALNCYIEEVVRSAFKTNTNEKVLRMQMQFLLTYAPEVLETETIKSHLPEFTGKTGLITLPFAA